jgi:hypothetical protein
VFCSAFALALASCDQQANQAGKFAKPADTPPKSAVADITKPEKPAEDFRSSVTPKSDAGGAQPGAAPQGAAQPADAELSTKVKGALSSAPGVNMGTLEVAARDGVVTLYGTVDMPAEKERAAMLAMGVDGVRAVVNNLVVVRGS